MLYALNRLKGVIFLSTRHSTPYGVKRLLTPYLDPLMSFLAAIFENIRRKLFLSPEMCSATQITWKKTSHMKESSERLIFCIILAAILKIWPPSL